MKVKRANRKRWSVFMQGMEDRDDRYNVIPPPVNEDEDDGESGEFEISIIRNTNRFGRRTWGYGGMNKIILFSQSGDNQIEGGAAVRKAIEMAHAMCETLNAKEL